MALAIETIDEQNIQVGTTDYELEIDITDGTENTDFELTGPWEGFYYDWDHANDVLIVKSDEVTRILQDAEWTLTATEGSQTATRTIIFNVMSVAPVIEIVETQSLFRDVNFLKSVAISNNPSSIQVNGLQAALKFEGSLEGVDLVGNLPTLGANLTTEQFDGTIVASNGGGEHTRTINIETASPLFLLSSNEVFVLDKNTPNNTQATPVSVFEYTHLNTSFARFIAYHNDKIYILDGYTPKVFNVDGTSETSLDNLGTGGLFWSFGNYSCLGFDVDENNVCFIRNDIQTPFTHQIHTEALNDGSQVRSFSLTSFYASEFLFLCVDDTYFYTHDRQPPSVRRLARISKTATGTNPSRTQYSDDVFRNNDALFLTVDDTNLYVMQSSTIYVFDKSNITNGPTRTFTIDSTGIARWDIAV